MLADILLEELEDAEAEFIGFVRALCGDDTVNYNDEVAASERETGYLNAAIANMLKYHGTINGDIESVLGFYFKMCSVEMSCKELAQAFLAFTNHSPFEYAGYKLSRSRIKRLNAAREAYENEDKIIVRPSGTEPKIKIYILLHGENREEINKKISLYEEDAKRITKS